MIRLQTFAAVATLCMSAAYASWAVKLTAAVSADHHQRANALARKVGFGRATLLKIGQHDTIYLLNEHEFNALPNAHQLIHHALAQHHGGEVEWFEHQQPRARPKRDAPLFNDPLYSQEWFLDSGVQQDGLKYDFDMQYLWRLGFNGTGRTIALVDDGLDMTHPDLRDSYDAVGSWDFNAGTPLQPPKHVHDNHGTRCAGQIVSKPNNLLCGVGLAHGANLSGIRLISENPTDASEAAALTYQYQRNEIYSSSWGPTDDGKSIDGPGYLGVTALREGVTNGRGGLGSVYVFASGNGGNQNDICTYDGYANSIYTVSIGAVTQDGKWPYYSEPCAAQLVAAYSGNGDATNIATTDISSSCPYPPCCSTQHFGTSAAAPFASSLIALMLQMRPELSWRDVQHVLVHSTIINDPTDLEWATNGAGLRVSHRYGFGTVNARQLMNATLSHELVPAQSSYVLTPKQSTAIVIPINNVPLILHFNVTHSDMLEADFTGASIIQSLEHVQLYVDIAHSRRQSLNIQLVSPSNTTSLLAKQRQSDYSTDGIRAWTFMTVRNWNESPLGEWKIVISDERQVGTLGKLLSYSLTLNGRACTEDEHITNKVTGRPQCPWEPVKAAQASRKQVNYAIMYSVLTLAVLVVISAVIIRWYRRRPNYRDLEYIKAVESPNTPTQPSIAKSFGTRPPQLSRTFMDRVRRTLTPLRTGRTSPVNNATYDLQQIVSPASSRPIRTPLTPTAYIPSPFSPQRGDAPASSSRPASSARPNSRQLGAKQLSLNTLRIQDAGQLKSPMPYDPLPQSSVSRPTASTSQSNLLSSRQ